MKYCFKCKEEKPLNSFHKNRARKDGLTNICKPCKSVYDKTTPSKSPDVVRVRDLNRFYKITQEQYDDMLAAQNYGCGICGSPDPGLNRVHFSVDHNHNCCPSSNTCGTCIRGLLCHYCNSVLLPVLESGLIDAGLNYLKRYSDA